MTTLALTIPDVAPAVQGAPLGDIVRRGLQWTLMLAGVVLTLYILSELGPVVYGLPVTLMRRAIPAGPSAV
jgi:hypothetical protein